MTNNQRIWAHGLTVDFPIFSTVNRSLKNTLLSTATGGRIARSATDHIVVRALDDIHLEVCEGERVGLMGHNGSGKTTLLRCLAGVYSPCRGRLTVAGRIASLLDIGLGMDPDATGYENIRLRSLIMGLRANEARKLIRDVEEFSELGEFLSMPMRNYSSGMVVRLAFAVSTAICADVVIMDEWLSVGDQSFQDKAAARLRNLIANSSVLVIASHSKELISRVCTRYLTLEHGRVVADNPVGSMEIINESSMVR